MVCGVDSHRHRKETTRCEHLSDYVADTIITTGRPQIELGVATIKNCRKSIQLGFSQQTGYPVPLRRRNVKLIDDHKCRRGHNHIRYLERIEIGRASCRERV